MITIYHREIENLIMSHANRQEVYAYFQTKHGHYKRTVDALLQKEGVDFPAYLAHEYTDEHK